MKYITHMTSSGDDEKHQALMDKAGVQGYGAYWLIAEKIAAQIRPGNESTSMTLTWRRWGLRLGIDQRSAQHVIRCMNDVQLISLRCENDLATVDMPNILKYADEYSKKVGIKSRQTPSILSQPEQHNTTEPKNQDISSSADDLQAAWNCICKSLSKCTKLTDKRRVHSKARLKERPLMEWESIFAKIEATPFLCGGGNTGWKADFDWITKSPDNAVKVLEGKYDPPGTTVYEKEKKEELTRCQSIGCTCKATTRIGNARYCADHVMEAM